MNKKSITNSLPKLFILSSLLTVLALPAQSQVIPADIGKPDFDSLSSPEFGGRNSKNFTAQDWLELESEMDIPAQSRKQEVLEFIDEVEVRWYVAIEDKAIKRPVLLTKEITHTNVPVGEKIFTSVYISPNALTRLTGLDRAIRSTVIVASVVVFVGGNQVGVATTKSSYNDDPRKGELWWTAASLSKSAQVPLLNKNETPFKAFWYDRYAEIKPERR